MKKKETTKTIHKRKTTQILIWISISLLLLSIPVIIAISVLYSNNQYYLNKFKEWIAIDGNIATLVMTLTMYLPLIFWVWKIILVMLETSRLKKPKHSKKFVKIYDDDNDTFIYYNKQDNKLKMSIKCGSDKSNKELLELIYNESKYRIDDYNKKNGLDKS